MRSVNYFDANSSDGGEDSMVLGIPDNGVQLPKARNFSHKHQVSQDIPLLWTPKAIADGKDISKAAKRLAPPRPSRSPQPGSTRNLGTFPTTPYPVTQFLEYDQFGEAE